MQAPHTLTEEQTSQEHFEAAVVVLPHQFRVCRLVFLHVENVQREGDAEQNGREQKGHPELRKVRVVCQAADVCHATHIRVPLERPARRKNAPRVPPHR